MNTIRAAVIQLCSTPDRAENLREAERWMVAAVAQGAGFLLLPENFSFMGTTDEEKYRHREDPESGPSVLFLRSFAQRNRVWIVGGSILLQAAGSDKMTNTCFVVDDLGQVRGRYDKIHLFDVDLGGETPYRESDAIEAGRRAVVVDAPFGRIGLTICYDLRFPELYRLLAAEGATILTVPAAFTQTTGQDHWEVLLRARAIENLAYVMAAGQGGHHPNGRRTFGHSLIVEPWGHVIAQSPEGSGFVLAELQPQRVEQSRKRIPCLNHRAAFV